MNHHRIALLLVTMLALAACAPQATSPDAPATRDAPSLESPAARETLQIAQIAYHRMEIGRLQTGSYTTNVLIDLAIPRGVRWTVLEFAEDAYLLRFTNDAVPSTTWLVDETGVRVGPAPTD